MVAVASVAGCVLLFTHFGGSQEADFRNLWSHTGVFSAFYSQYLVAARDHLFSLFLLLLPILVALISAGEAANHLPTHRYHAFLYFA